MIQNIFKKAWQITKKNKFLWLLGILITAFGQESTTNLIFDKTNLVSTGDKMQSLKSFFYNGDFALFIKSFNDLFAARPLLIILFALITVSFILLAIFINITAQGALIHCSQKLNQDKKTAFKEGFLVGIKNFWSLFSVFILGKLFIILLAAIFVIPLLIAFLATGAYQWLLLGLLFILIIIIPSIYFVFFITPYSFCYIILNKKTTLDSIKKSIKLFFNNFLINLRFALSLFLIFTLVLLFSPLISSLVALPLVLIGLIFNSFSLAAISWTIMALSSILISGITLIFFGVFTSFQYNSWVSLFNELTKTKSLK